MKVLMYIRRDYLDNMAGDTIQLKKTQEYLKKRGIDVTISSNPYDNLVKYDLIHLFNTIRIEDTYRFFKNAKKINKKIVISPIYWNYIKYIDINKKTEILHFSWKQQNILRQEVLSNVDLILPSSVIEMTEIIKDFRITTPYIVIPNGVDRSFEEDKSKEFQRLYNIDKFILSVARISPHKNQLNLSIICKSLNIPLILVGPINDNSYYYECLKYNKEIIYVPKVNQQELISFYSAATAHVLVSWYEIPGLVNLEAGLAGCNIVTTKDGSTREYLKDYVLYSTYNEIDDIKRKIEIAFSSNKDYRLREHIKANYLWDIVAEKLIKAYESIFNT